MAPYARVETTLIALLGTAATITTAYFAAWWAIVPAVLALALLAFYRDPTRTPPQRDDLLLAPADGRIVEIDRGIAGSGGGGGKLRIVVFLSVFDVHINRSPCAGRVIDVVYRPGEFLNALQAESTDCNESNLLTIDPRPPLPGPIHVRQIAGLLARRIVCAAKPGDDVAPGERFGMIKLGSRTEVSVPEDARWRIVVSVGDHVAAGTTPLAELQTA